MHACPFCEPMEASRHLFSSQCFYAVFDRAPVTEGHALIISKQHRPNIWHLTDKEWDDLRYALRQTMIQLTMLFRLEAFNVGTNCGEDAGQTVMHFHLHVIPRRKGDVENPRGGIRNLMKPLQELWPGE